MPKEISRETLRIRKIRAKARKKAKMGVTGGLIAALVGMACLEDERKARKN